MIVINDVSDIQLASYPPARWAMDEAMGESVPTPHLAGTSPLIWKVMDELQSTTKSAGIAPPHSFTGYSMI